MPLTDAFLFPPLPSVSATKPQNLTLTSPIPKNGGLLLSSIAPLALTLVVSSSAPSLATTTTSPRTTLLPPTTPYSQSQTLQTGLEQGRIRPCPAINPSCVSTNAKSSSFAFPWAIPENSLDDNVQKLRDAILKTQRNVNFQADEDTQDGHYLQAEVDGGFGRDVMEFLVKRDVVSYRAMATKVTYIYPFTTALGDSKGQKERVNKILQELGWYAPDFESMY